jgi:4-hydroxy-tetrahydrodipicolinate synthase
VLARLGIGHGLRLPLTSLSPAHDRLAVRITDEIQQLERACRDTLAT